MRSIRASRSIPGATEALNSLMFASPSRFHFSADYRFEIGPENGGRAALADLERPAVADPPRAIDLTVEQTVQCALSQIGSDQLQRELDRPSRTRLAMGDREVQPVPDPVVPSRVA